MRLTFASMLALLLLARTLQADAQGADHSGGHIDRGDAHMNRSDWDSAIADFGTVIALNPKDAEALRGRGYVRLNRHDIDAAIADLTAAIALNPRDALAFRFRGAAYAAAKDPRRASLDDAAAAQLNPSMHRCQSVSRLFTMKDFVQETSCCDT